jgi:hypothetical protein
MVNPQPAERSPHFRFNGPQNVLPIEICTYHHRPCKAPLGLYLKKEQTQTSTGKKREHTHLIHFYNKVRPIIILPCSPTKSLGAIKQNCRLHPTTNRLDLRVAVCGWIWPGDGAAALFTGCILSVNCTQWGAWIPWPNRNGRAKSDRPSWSKNQPYHNQPLGALSGDELAYIRKG